MPKSLFSFLIVPFVQFYFGVLFYWTHQVAHLSVYVDCQYLAGQASAYALSNLGSRYAFFILAHATVGECNFNHNFNRLIDAQRYEISGH